jgi:MFS transporter, DHA1 family, multidrug resistance protein
MKKHIFVLMLLISFGSIGAVIFTPGLPQIAKYFMVDTATSELTVTWYLVGYAFGQLIYGALVNRFGSKTTITIGTVLAIIGTIMCILSHTLHSFSLANKLFNHQESARVMGLLTMSFAITPGLGVFVGGLSVTYFNWTTPFYIMVTYALILLLISRHLPETCTTKDYNALKLNYLFSNYWAQFKDSSVIFGGLLVGLGSCIVYIFAALSPFIAMNNMHLTPKSYGIYNFIPSVGILIGSLLSNHLGQLWSPKKSLKFGLSVSFTGVFLLILSFMLFKTQPLALFTPMVIIYFGLSFIFGNSAALALHNSKDKSNASAVMSFINMGSAFLVVMLFSFYTITQAIMLPITFLILLGLGIVWYRLLIKTINNNYVQNVQ